MSSIPWVLFDLGNVLVPFDHRRIAHKLRAVLPSISEEQLHEFFFGSETGQSLNEQIDKGKVTLEEYHQVFKKRFSTKLSYALFHDAFADIFDDLLPIPMACLKRLNEASYCIAICSNTNVVHWKHLIRKYPELLSQPLLHFLSYEMGVTKSSPDYFKTVVEMTGCEPEEHLLLDDLSINLQVAASCGIRTLQVAEEFPEAELYAILGL